MTLLQENIDKIFSDINHTNVFLGQSPKALEIKTKINKWDLIKLTNFCTAKETINKMKRQPTDRENICKQCNRQGLNLQNIKTSSYNSTTTKKQPNQKNGQKT